MEARIKQKVEREIQRLCEQLEIPRVKIMELWWNQIQQKGIFFQSIQQVQS